MTYRDNTFNCPYPGCASKLEAQELPAHAATKHSACIQTLSCPICERETVLPLLLFAPPHHRATKPLPSPPTNYSPLASGCGATGHHLHTQRKHEPSPAPGQRAWRPVRGRVLFTLFGHSVSTHPARCVMMTSRAEMHQALMMSRSMYVEQCIKPVELPKEVGKGSQGTSIKLEAVALSLSVR